MKSVQISRYGDFSTLILTDSEVPLVESGQVLVEVCAVGLNPVDSAVLKGYMKDMIPLSFPVTLGGDIAGVITQVADDVTEFAVGDHIFGQSMAPADSGALAEYATASVKKLALMPNGLSFGEAASLPLAEASALQALKTIDLSPGEKVFINGGTGGIGSVATQIAKDLGAYVAVTASSRYIRQAIDLGADETIDYKAEAFADKLSEYDAILDTAGADFTAMAKILKTGGTIVSLTGSADAAEGIRLGVKATNQFTHVTHEILLELARYVESGVLKPQVGMQFNFDEFAEAFKQLENGSVLGKIVITVK